MNISWESALKIAGYDILNDDIIYDGIKVATVVLGFQFKIYDSSHESTIKDILKYLNKNGGNYKII